MRLLNGTRLPATVTLGLDSTGREHALVVVKGTYGIPTRGGAAALAHEQVEICAADTFTGEPGLSSVIYESEFALHKPRCDVLLVGSAHAPGGRPAAVVPVALRVGAMSKGFHVVGPRRWTVGGAGAVRPEDPEPFTSMPLSYDIAYGGTEPSRSAPGLSNAYMANPVGRGFFQETPADEIYGQPAPCTEEAYSPIRSPGGTYTPMSFGPIGRNFAQRIQYAGTYDDRWYSDQFPFLPKDFDDRYFQAAPSDQQIPHVQGGEVVQLLNLSPQPIAPFELPGLALPVEFTRGRSTTSELKAAVADTIIIEPDLERLQVVWRASTPIREGLLEISQVVVGRMSRGWYRARETGKRYTPLAEVHLLKELEP